jgi:hypothetical protein
VLRVSILSAAFAREVVVVVCSKTCDCSYIMPLTMSEFTFLSIQIRVCTFSRFNALGVMRVSGSYCVLSYQPSV